VRADLVTTRLVELPALATRRHAFVIDADDFGHPLESSEERRRRRVKVDQHGGRPLVLQAVIDDDRRLDGERTAKPAMGKESGRRPEPEEPPESRGGFLAVGQHANASVIGPRFRHESRRDLESIGAMRIEVDDRHCRE